MPTAEPARTQSLPPGAQRTSGRKARPGTPPTGPRQSCSRTLLASAVEDADLLCARSGAAPRDMLDAPERVDMAEAMQATSEPRSIDLIGDINVLTAALSCLSAREERVIRLRFGLGGHGEWTLQQIGEEFGVNPQRIRQIEMKALRRLRHQFRKRYGPLPMDPKPKSLPAAAQATGCESVKASPSRAPGPGPVVRRAKTVPTATVVRPVPVRHGADPGRENGISGGILTLLIGMFLFAMTFDQTVGFHLGRHLGPGPALLVCGLNFICGAAVFCQGWTVIREGDAIVCGRAAALRTLLLGACLGLALYGFRSPELYQFLLDMSASTPPRFRGDMPLKMSVFMGLFIIIGALHLPNRLLSWRKGQPLSA